MAKAHLHARIPNHDCKGCEDCAAPHNEPAHVASPCKLGTLRKKVEAPRATLPSAQLHVLLQRYVAQRRHKRAVRSVGSQLVAEVSSSTSSVCEPTSSAS